VDLMSEDPGISISEYAESVLTNLRFFGFWLFWTGYFFVKNVRPFLLKYAGKLVSTNIHLYKAGIKVQIINN
jgi:hypothetical protein